MHENSQMEQVQELWCIRPAQSACLFEWQQQWSVSDILHIWSEFIIF